SRRTRPRSLKPRRPSQQRSDKPWVDKLWTHRPMAVRNLQIRATADCRSSRAHNAMSRPADASIIPSGLPTARTSPIGDRGSFASVNPSAHTPRPTLFFHRAAGIGPILEAADIVDMAIPHVLEHLAGQRRAAARGAVEDHVLVLGK